MSGTAARSATEVVTRDRHHAVLARNRLLLVLTLSSGAIEAICFLGLGKVFTAFMTGYFVFLGLRIAGAPATTGASSRGWLHLQAVRGSTDFRSARDLHSQFGCLVVCRARRHQGALGASARGAGPESSNQFVFRDGADDLGELGWRGAVARLATNGAGIRHVADVPRPPGA